MKPLFKDSVYFKRGKDPLPFIGTYSRSDAWRYSGPIAKELDKRFRAYAKEHGVVNPIDVPLFDTLLREAKVNNRTRKSICFFGTYYEEVLDSVIPRVALRGVIEGAECLSDYDPDLIYAPAYINSCFEDRIIYLDTYTEEFIDRIEENGSMIEAMRKEFEFLSTYDVDAEKFVNDFKCDMELFTVDCGRYFNRYVRININKLINRL